MPVSGCVVVWLCVCVCECVVVCVVVCVIVCVIVGVVGMTWLGVPWGVVTHCLLVMSPTELAICELHWLLPMAIH